MELLVARAAELAAVAQVIGSSGAVVVRGEPGVGKTALLEAALAGGCCGPRRRGGCDLVCGPDAEAEYRQVLDARLRVPGLAHPDTLAARHGITAALSAQGRAADAEAEYRQVLDSRLRVQGPAHPDTHTVREAIRRLAR